MDIDEPTQTKVETQLNEKDKSKKNASSFFSSAVETLKNIKELIVIFIFFIGGAIATIKYFATQEQLKEYQCISDSNVRMIQGKMDSDFLSQMIKSSRREQREARKSLEHTKKDTDAYKTIEDNIDNLEAQLTDFQDKYKSSKQQSEAAFEKLRKNECKI